MYPDNFIKRFICNHPDIRLIIITECQQGFNCGTENLWKFGILSDSRRTYSFDDDGTAWHLLLPTIEAFAFIKEQIVIKEVFTVHTLLQDPTECPTLVTHSAFPRLSTRRLNEPCWIFEWPSLLRRTTSNNRATGEWHSAASWPKIYDRSWHTHITNYIATCWPMLANHQSIEPWTL